MARQTKTLRELAALFDVLAEQISLAFRVSVLGGHSAAQSLEAASAALYSLLVIGVSISSQLQASKPVGVPGAPIVRGARRRAVTPLQPQDESRGAARMFEETAATVMPPLIEAAAAQEQQVAQVANLSRQLAGESLLGINSMLAKVVQVASFVRPSTVSNAYSAIPQISPASAPASAAVPLMNQAAPPVPSTALRPVSELSRGPKIQQPEPEAISANTGRTEPPEGGTPSVSPIETHRDEASPFGAIGPPRMASTQPEQYTPVALALSQTGLQGLPDSVAQSPGFGTASRASAGLSSALKLAIPVSLAAGLAAGLTASLPRILDSAPAQILTSNVAVTSAASPLLISSLSSIGFLSPYTGRTSVAADHGAPEVSLQGSFAKQQSDDLRTSSNVNGALTGYQAGGTPGIVPVEARARVSTPTGHDLDAAATAAAVVASPRPEDTIPLRHSSETEPFAQLRSTTGTSPVPPGSSSSVNAVAPLLALPFLSVNPEFANGLANLNRLSAESSITSLGTRSLLTNSLHKAVFVFPSASGSSSVGTSNLATQTSAQERATPMEITSPPTAEYRQSEDAVGTNQTGRDAYTPSAPGSVTSEPGVPLTRWMGESATGGSADLSQQSASASISLTNLPVALGAAMLAGTGGFLLGRMDIASSMSSSPATAIGSVLGPVTTALGGTRALADKVLGVSAPAGIEAAQLATPESSTTTQLRSPRLLRAAGLGGGVKGSATEIRPESSGATGESSVSPAQPQTTLNSEQEPTLAAPGPTRGSLGLPTTLAGVMPLLAQVSSMEADGRSAGVSAAQVISSAMARRAGTLPSITQLQAPPRSELYQVPGEVKSTLGSLTPLIPVKGTPEPTRPEQTVSEEEELSQLRKKIEKLLAEELRRYGHQI
jgi:hypothetical protein